MVKLSSAEAHPAFVQSMLRSICFHQFHDERALTKESLIEIYGVADRGAGMANTLAACRQLGAANVSADGVIALAEDWICAVTSTVPRHALALKISEVLKRGDDLFELCAGLLRTPVLSDKSIDDWRNQWPGPSSEAPFGTDITQRNNAIFWMQYLGWVRPMGKNHYIPDFTQWLTTWARHHQPSGKRAVLRESWEVWCRALPPLKTIQVDDGVPEAMGVALDALERRGFARFYDEADSSEVSLQWRIGSDRRAYRFVDWLDPEVST